MFNDLERIFNLLDWDVKSYSYCRPTLDSKPYQIIKDKDGKKSTIIFNALGIKKDNIEVSIERNQGQDYLTISGETKNELMNKAYNVSGRFVIDSNEVDEIDWDCSDGLLVIEIKFKEPEKSNIKINKK